MKKIDILLLARPDHSLQIYNELSNQNKITFHFLSFRVLKRWLSFLHIPKISYVGKNSTILIRLTIRHILKYKFKKFTNLDEKFYFERGTKNILANYDPQIIHYWPSFCNDIINSYKKRHPNIIAIADQYMPNPIYVLKIMKPIYEKYGISYTNKYLETYAHSIFNHFDGADYLCVPSKFVEETMRITFPNLKYLYVSYGISIASDYKFIKKENRIKRFVYVGSISLEKGSDIILEYFFQRTDLELHLFGIINSNQKTVFEKYMKCCNIFFHGAVSKEMLRKQFKTMDVGIHPSRFDAYSLAVGEEIGSGLPVIVSDHTGIKDDVIKYGWGTVFETESFNSLENAIKTMECLDQYNVYKLNIDEYINKPYHYNYGQNIINLYDKLLKK